MTYCCGMLVKDGLVMIADTRTNAGVDNISTFRKLTVFSKPGEHVFALATAGSLSVTQSAMSLMAEGLFNPDSGQVETLEGQTSMFKACPSCRSASPSTASPSSTGRSAATRRLRRCSRWA